MKKVSNSIILQLQIVFSVSIILLLLSLASSFYSIQRLIEHTKAVNHTNEVLNQAESIISYLKDAETSQRGYLLTMDSSFLQHYNGAHNYTTLAYQRLVNLTTDNPAQQKILVVLKKQYEDRFDQINRVIDISKGRLVSEADYAQRLLEMRRGKKIMDDLRATVREIQKEEERLLAIQMESQNVYIVYTPFFLVFAALVSIAITLFAYLRIRKDMDIRLRKQREEQEKYEQTQSRIADMEQLTRAVSAGDYAIRSQDIGEDDLGHIGQALNSMTDSLQRTFTDLESKAWLQTGSMQISDAIRGERQVKNLSKSLLEVLTSYLHAPIGTVHIQNIEGEYRLEASFANGNAPLKLIPGNGSVGQVIQSQKIALINDLPDNYTNITSSLGSSKPASVIILPLIYLSECIGVIELGFLKHPTDLQLKFLKDNLEPIAIGVNGALDYLKLQNFLEETQAQSEELQAQHRELESVNTELEAQSLSLQASEEELRVQQEELQQINEELEERSLLLEERNEEVLRKAQELELTTRYKSEFLANMSHELRTPLNSILLLSRLLSENDQQNLTEDQIEFANVIRSSGNGLLTLIDEILDLSKIEAGKMDLEYTQVAVKDIIYELESMFGPVARDKGLIFQVEKDINVLETLETDKGRVLQILNNLVSNALKFTANGSVKVSIEGTGEYIIFSVIDTGIGIDADKLKFIFEAFQQADGSTKRKYGGTGLGLSISKQLTKLLGGNLSVSSTPGAGSTFKVSIPIIKTERIIDEPVETVIEIVESPVFEPISYISTVIPESLPDDRKTINTGDKVILIVEDDTIFAKTLLDYTRKSGYKGIVAVRGDEGLQLAEKFLPMGILLDIELPVLNGWQVMETLKSNPRTRQIPVHIISSHRMKNEGIMKGAVDVIDKAVVMDKLGQVFEKLEYVISKEAKKVLILEENSMHAKALAYFLETFNIHSELKSSINDGAEALKDPNVDCVILDMGIPDQAAYNALEEVKQNPDLENVPVIIFTGKSLSMSEELKIKQYADSIVVKTAHSYQRMLDEVSLFLHVVEENKNSSQSFKPTKLGALGEILNNKTVLVADDDVRNIFSLSKSLETYKMNVVTALDGREAIEKLEQHPEIDIVLLDMMMPHMDGYETARRIRQNPKLKTLPIIAVTAKAMAGDREKCINAGSSDYITKPVDIDQLISLLRVWLYEKI